MKFFFLSVNNISKVLTIAFISEKYKNNKVLKHMPAKINLKF